MTRSLRRLPTTGVVVAAVTLGAYLGLLAWDQQKTRDAHGNLHGPYELWQIVVLVTVLVGAAVWTGWRGNPAAGAVAAAVVLTVSWSVDAATDAEKDGLWPVGAFGVCVGTLTGFLLVAAVTQAAARRFGRPSNGAS